VIDVQCCRDRRRGNGRSSYGIRPHPPPQVVHSPMYTRRSMTPLNSRGSETQVHIPVDTGFNITHYARCLHTSQGNLLQPRLWSAQTRVVKVYGLIYKCIASGNQKYCKGRMSPFHTYWSQTQTGPPPPPATKLSVR